MPAKHQGELHFVDGLLAVHIDDPDPEARSARRERVLQAVDGRMAGLDQLQSEFADLEMIARVSRFVEILAVDDPVAAADALAEQPEISASPIHELGFSWHQPYSATPPDDLGDMEYPAVPAGSRNRVIAMVDTGIVEPHLLPDWMSSSIVHGQDDIERPGTKMVSHGTFVASLLRQIAPSHAVSIARSAAYPGDRQKRSKKHPEPYPTTELHVADAILRLIERHEGGCAVEVLNLSVGGPTLGGRAMTVVEAALSVWMTVFPRAPIFAAAGNSPMPNPIFPAAFRHVRGVSAGLAGEQIAWDTSGRVVRYPGRPWVDDVAPGEGLIGLSGRGPKDTVAWSGSSFATAAATASWVNAGPVEAEHGISWWPDRWVRYGSMPGLRFQR